MKDKKTKNYDRQAELENCNFVKIILMLLVVLGHCVIFWGGKWFTGDPVYEVKPLAMFDQWLKSFHVFGFALVSGYLFYHIKYEKGRYGKFGSFVGQKAKRLLVPYGFAALVWAIPAAIIFSLVDGPSLILNFFLGAAPNQLWFLLMLFGVFLIVYPLSDFLKKQNIWGAVVVLCFYGVGVIGSRLPNLFQIFTACLYMPVFWMGFKLRQWGTAKFRKIPAILWLVVQIALFALSQYVAQLPGTVFTLIKIALEFVLRLWGAVMIFILLQNIAGWRKSKGKVLTFLSKTSMPVYLLHQQVIYVCIYFLNGVLNPYLHAAVNLVIALPVSLALAALLRKWKVTRFLLGEG